MTAVTFLSEGNKEPLLLKHIKPWLLRHWGSTPGQDFIYVHFNRQIKKRDLNVIYVAGPRHGGPALVVNTYLEGTYSEFPPHIPQTEGGLKRLSKQFSFPGGITSNVSRRRRAQFMKSVSWHTRLPTHRKQPSDDQDLLVCCVVGDSEAETSTRSQLAPD